VSDYTLPFLIVLLYGFVLGVFVGRVTR